MMYGWASQQIIFTFTIMNISSTTLTKSLNTLLKTHFGFDAFRPNQEQIIRQVVNKKDAIAIMPTGGGKSLCFQLPALAMQGTAIVISPLIALMKDQVDALHANGIEAAFYNSSQPEGVQAKILETLLAGDLQLIYVAPESLWTLNQYLSKIKINLIAVDEAHCISAWGHDFRPAYTQLNRLKIEFPGVPVIALTATADRATQDDIAVQLGIPKAKKFISSFDRPNLYLDVRPGQDRIKQIFRFLKSREDESGIIYCLSRKSTEKLSSKLTAKGYDAAAYHAGLTSEERSRIQEDFINDRVPIVVATIAFGMGIDKSNVRWVIHYNMPKNIEGYYQEIGRSGRDGLPAHTLLFYSFADVIMLRKFAEGSETEAYQLAKLDRMQQFAESLSCRRKTLLNYFGEFIYTDCGNCDICKNPPQYFDGTLIAQKVCSAVARLKEMEPMGMVLDVLRGSQNAQVFDQGYQHLKTFGAAQDISWRDLQQYIIQLLNLGVLEIRFHQKGRLLLTSLAKEVLFERKNVQLATLKRQEKTTQNSTQKTSTNNTPETLFDELKALRLQLATQMGVPAYVVFSDASLKEMQRIKPKDEVAFSEITGVGQAKLEKYADAFLKVIANHKGSSVSAESTEAQSFHLYKEGLSVSKIAETRALTESTIYGHFIKVHQQGADININDFVTTEEISAIEKAKSRLENPDGLRPYFEHFEEKMPYWKLKFGLYLLEE